TNISANHTATATVSANLHGVGATLTKISTGKTVLSGTNDYSGNTVITAGSVQIGNGGTSGSIVGNVTNNATLIFNRANNYTFGGIITGTGNLTNSGTGVLTLSAANGYSGATTVSAGTLKAATSAALGTGNVFVDATGTLAMTGTLALSGNLTNNGGTISIGLTSNPASGNDQVTVAGSLQNTADSKIAIRGLSGGVLGAGTYTLITSSSTNATPVFTLAQNIANATLAFSGTTLTLVVGGGGAVVPEIWAGDGAGNAWDVATTPNWTLGTGGPAVGFTNGLDVVFEDSTANTTVNLNTTVTPNSVTVSATSNYVITGSGKISGSTAITKTGSSGILKLDGVNDYTGGTVINGGSLFVSSNNAAGSGDITLNTGHNALAAVQNVSLANNINLVAGTGLFGISGGGTAANGYSSNLVINGSVNLNGSAKILSTRTTQLTLNGSVTNGDIVVFNGNANTGNTLTLAGNNTFTAGVTMTNGGELDINSATALGASSGTLVFGGSQPLVLDNTSAGSISNANNNPVTISKGVTFNGTRDLNLGTGAVTIAAAFPTLSVTANTLTLAGAVGEDIAGRMLVKAGNGTLVLSGANTFSGGLTNSAGTLKINNASALGTGKFTLAGGSIDNTSGSAIVNANNNVQAWNSDFTFFGASDLDLGTGAVALSANRTVTASAGNLTVGGVISGTAFSLTKVGSGTLTLSGANSFTGNLTNSAGTLVVPTVNNASAAGPLGNNANAVSLGSSGNTAVLEYTGATASSSKKLNLVTGGTGEVKIDDSGAILTATGVIDGSGNLTKTGSGALRLNAVNLFTGNLTLSAGTLIAGGANTTCLGAGTLTLGGGEIQMISDSGRNYGRNTTVNGNVTMTSDKSSAGGAGQTYTFGTLAIGAQTLTVKAAENPDSGTAGVTFGAVTLSGAPTFYVTNNTLGATTLLTLNGTVSGAAGLTKDGNGQLTLAQSNSYAGDTTVSAGQLILNDKDAIGRGTLFINGGFAQVAIGSTAITNNVVNNSGLQVNGNGVLTGTLSGSGWVNHVGGGAFTMTLGGTNTGFSGVITNYGTMAMRNRWAPGTGTIYMGDGVGAASSSLEVASGSSGSFTGVDAITNPIVLLGLSSFGNNQRALEIAGVVSGSGALANAGTSTLTLSGDNTFSGGMTVKSSTLLVKNPTGSGTGSGAVVVTNTSTLGGSGAIAGAVTAYTGTTVKPGLGGTDTSPLTINNNLTLDAGGTTLIGINRTNSPNTAATLNITGTLAKAGTLTVTNVGSALQGGDSFTIFNVTGGASGSFSATNLPTLGAGLNWYPTNNAQTLIVNRAPTASALTMGALRGEPQTLKIIGGKHAPGDADTDGLTIAGVTQGAHSTAVTTDGTNVTYTSTNTFTGVDVFNYVVTDSRGGYATNTVTVTVIPNEGYNLISPVGTITNGTVELRFAGIPTFPYALDWATNLTAPINWMPVITNNADTNGLVNFTNTSAEPANYFRTRTP
ncbi:MAG: autotransporter-associated beta strand repeat-containing protein, partial [Verrucomicrobia bacterium]|nr:autotransporter-associated beta strand repeat-containing protein [Verrucomicrobiota bacterium]